MLNERLIGSGRSRVEELSVQPLAFALADEARRQAKMAVSEGMRDAYAIMAMQWDKLAEDAEGLAKKLRIEAPRFGITTRPRAARHG